MGSGCARDLDALAAAAADLALAREPTPRWGWGWSAEKMRPEMEQMLRRPDEAAGARLVFWLLGPKPGTRTDNDRLVSDLRSRMMRWVALCRTAFVPVGACRAGLVEMVTGRNSGGAMWDGEPGERRARQRVRAMRAVLRVTSEAARNST